MNMVDVQAVSNVEPYVELAEGGGGVVLTAETPGVKAEDVGVRVSDDRIRLTLKDNGVTVYHRVFRTGRLNTKAANIRYKNGVIEVKVPYRKTIF